jgi:DNA processing protein
MGQDVPVSPVEELTSSMHRDLDSWQRLGMAAGIGPVLFRQLVTHFGTPGGALQAPADELRQLPGIDARRAEAIRRAARTPLTNGWQARLRRLPAAVQTYQDRAYPRRLLTIYDYPPVLFLRGTVRPADELAVAVVGSRKASPYGLRMTRRLTAELTRRGVTVVSGLARGIDTEAHRTALECGGRTIAVLGSGVDVIYPRENRSLADRIAGRGAIISEFAPGTVPEPGFFPRRNRIISGLSLGVVIVEARRRSGALITARYAADQGREVYAVPGPVDQPGSAGPHGLIQDGAKLVTCVEDILEEVSQLSRICRKTGESTGGRPEQGLTVEERRLLGALINEPTVIDELIGRLGWGPSRVLAVLFSLEVKGLVRQLAGKRFLRIDHSRLPESPG